MTERKNYEFTVKICATLEDARRVLDATADGIAAILHDPDEQVGEVEISATQLREKNDD